MVNATEVGPGKFEAKPRELEAKPRVAPVIAALGLGESGMDLIRAASALARESGAELECLTIDTGRAASAEEGARMAEALRLARGLGAQIVNEPNIDAAAGIRKRAAERGASKVVVGQGRRRLLARGIADRLRAGEGDFAVVAVAAPRMGGRGRRMAPNRSTASLEDSAGHYVGAILAIAAVTGINIVLAAYAGYWAAAITYLAAISLLALVLDRWPVLLAALLSAIAWDFFFIPPRFTMRISRTEDVLMLALYLVVALCSGWLTGRLRASERLLAVRESRMSRLSSLAHALAGARTMGAIVASSVESLREAFAAEAILMLRESGTSLRSEAETGWEPLDANARGAASLCFEAMKSTGRYTESWPASEWHFVPMEGPQGCLGVIGLRAAHDRVWDEALESFLRTMALTVSSAVARETPEA
jgi:two-component system sensor histidine kinase KdpD